MWQVTFVSNYELFDMSLQSGLSWRLEGAECLAPPETVSFKEVMEAQEAINREEGVNGAELEQLGMAALKELPAEKQYSIMAGFRDFSDRLKVCEASKLACESTWEDKETPPVPVGVFRSVSLDVCGGNAACTWVSQSGVRGTVGACCLGAVCVCVCSLSSVELCDVLSSGRWPGVFIVTPLAFIRWTHVDASTRMGRGVLWLVSPSRTRRSL